MARSVPIYGSEQDALLGFNIGGVNAGEQPSCAGRRVYTSSRS
jgi:hypothetical protein